MVSTVKYIAFLLALLACHTCAAQADGKVWWKETVFYQIYMPSFADSNGDGYGDFKGISGKLGYLNALGVKGLWLTPFLKSPKVDNGYDVADYYRIDPTYGTMGDFRNFLKEAHDNGIKVVMDMVLNHTSTDSQWFQESKKSKDNKYRDYYIWKDKPNNWESFFGGTAWQKDDATGQYYYHKFDVRMADLNWANPEVVSEVQKVLRFWLDAGVDGFRLDVINFLTTDGITADNPMQDGKQEHVNDIDQTGVKNVMRIINSTVNEYKDRFIVGEIGSDKIEVLKQYQSPELLDVVFNFNFGSIAEFSTDRIFAELQSMEAKMSSYPTLFFGSHDMPRIMDRLAGGNKERAETLAALILTAKGVPFIYYGDEIGMHNVKASSLKEIVDIQGITHYKMAIAEGKTEAKALDEGNAYNRDKSRGPMQWDSNAFAGFSCCKSWIKMAEGYQAVNVAAQDVEMNSLLKAYTSLIKLRNTEKALQYGAYEKLEKDHDIISYSRVCGNDKITVYLNFGDSRQIEIPNGARILIGVKNLRQNHYLIYKEQR